MKRSYPDDLVIGNLSRRGFLKGVGATGVLLVAANWGWRDALAAEKKAFGADAMPHGWVDNPKIYGTARSASSATARKWARACAPAWRWWWPTSWRPTGAGSR